MKNGRQSGGIIGKMNDYKISKKLVISFDTLAAIIVLVLLFCVYSIYTANFRMNSLNDNNLTGVAAVGGMPETFQQERTLTRSLILFAPGSEDYTKSIWTMDNSLILLLNFENVLYKPNLEITK